MLFVKDLGPTAQNIAKRKLLGCEIRTASASAPGIPNTFAPVLMSQNPLNWFLDHRNKMRSPVEKIDLESASEGEKVGRTSNAEREKNCGPLYGDTQQSHKWSLWCNKVFPNQNSCSDSHYLRACVEYLNCTAHGSNETGKKSKTMLLDKLKLVNQEQLSVDKCHTNVLESRLENNCQCQSRPWTLESSDVSCFDRDKSQMQKSSSKCALLGDRENIEAQFPTNGISCSFKAMENLKSDLTVPPTSNFICNLPYLKTRLDQINS